MRRFYVLLTKLNVLLLFLGGPPRGAPLLRSLRPRRRRVAGLAAGVLFTDLYAAVVVPRSMLQRKCRLSCLDGSTARHHYCLLR